MTSLVTSDISEKTLKQSAVCELDTMIVIKHLNFVAHTVIPLLYGLVALSLLGSYCISIREIIG